MNKNDIPIELIQHPRAKALLDTLREFWGPITFIQKLNEGPNRYRIQPKGEKYLRAEILFSRDFRVLEGLVHELLHLELFHLGYPRFYTKQEGINPKFVSQVNNATQHKVMLPLFKEFGFDPELFESDRPEYGEFEKEIIQQIENLEPFDGIENYTRKVSMLFERLGIGIKLGYYLNQGLDGVEFIDEHEANKAVDETSGSDASLRSSL